MYFCRWLNDLHVLILYDLPFYETKVENFWDKLSAYFVKINYYVQNKRTFRDTV